MSFMNFIAKFIRELTAVTALQTSLFRALGMAIGSYTFCRVIKIDVLQVPKEKAWALLGRSFFGYFSITNLFLSIFLLPFSLS